MNDPDADFYRHHWGKVHERFRTMTDDEILLVLEQTECQQWMKRKGRIPPHVSRVTKRWVKSCSSCDGMMLYGAHDVARQGMSGEDYRQQNRYWLCEGCGATEART